MDHKPFFPQSHICTELDFLQQKTPAICKGSSQSINFSQQNVIKYNITKITDRVTRGRDWGVLR